MKKGFIAIPLLIIAIIGLTVGIGFAVEKQKDHSTKAEEVSGVLTANVVDNTSTCQCEITKKDLLTKDDVVSIVMGLYDSGLIKNTEVVYKSGDELTKADVLNIMSEAISQGLVVTKKGDKGDQGIQGIQGQKGDKGEKGEKGDSALGKLVRYCSSEDGLELYPEDKDCLYSAPLCDGCDFLYKDCCTMKHGGKIINMWVTE